MVGFACGWVMWGGSEDEEAVVWVGRCWKVGIFLWLSISVIVICREGRRGCLLVKKRQPDQQEEGAVLDAVIWTMFLVCLCSDMITKGSLS